MEILLVILFSPWFWIIAFIAKTIFQFFLAQKLNFKNAWFAFFPILNLVQWFQLGKTSAWNICWIFLPIIGSIIYLYQWFKATIKICERAGERGSFSVLLFFPYISHVALIRLAFKTGYWVRTDLEKDLIQKTIKGLEAGHSQVALRDFAITHGVKLDDFEVALDRALIIKSHNLKVASEKFDSPVALNIGVAVFYVFSSLFFAFYVLTVGMMSFLGALFAGDFSAISSSSSEKSSQAQTDISPSILEEYAFFMTVQGFSQEQSIKPYSAFEGETIKGSLGEAQWVYVLDQAYNLIDLVKINEEGTSIILNEINPSTVSAVAITPDLAQKNQSWSEDVRALEPSEPVLLLQEQQSVPSGSNLRDIVVEVKMQALVASDGLYIYDKDFTLIGAAKIRQIYKTSDSNKLEQETIQPGQRASLRLELARPNIEAAFYLTPYEDIKPWVEYLSRLNLNRVSTP